MLVLPPDLLSLVQGKSACLTQISRPTLLIPLFME